VFPFASALFCKQGQGIMKRTRWVWLLSVSLVVLAGAGLSADEADEKILAQVDLKADGPTLLAFFKQRTLSDTETIQLEALIQQLGADSFAKRELATAKLIARGPVVVPLLKKYFQNPDLEIADRAKKCVLEIESKDKFTPHEFKAALHVLVERKPAGTVEVLLQYLPFATKEEVAEETRKTLAALALADGKAAPALVKGLTDKNPIIRSAAGEALALAKDREHEKEVWKLLEDPDLLVKFRVALGLTLAEHPKAVPALIDLVPDLDWPQACQVEELLVRLAVDQKPPDESLGQSKKARQEFVKGWHKWWKNNSTKVNLADLKGGPKILGYTVLVLLEAGQIIELGQNNEIRWQLTNLDFPLDVQLLPNDRVLVAEYHASRVTERDLKGKILWQHNCVSPQAAQRLKNGNTFIVSDKEMIEVTPDKNQVFAYSFPNMERVMKAVKVDKAGDGRIVCLTNSPRVVVLDEKGTIQKKFPIPGMVKLLFGGRLYLTPTGRVLIPFNSENKVVEYSLDGEEVSVLKVDQPVAAVRLFNGNTLVTTMDTPGKVIEFDRTGTEVWSYQTKLANTKITRALRH
jgi:HEAT repeat protein